MKNFLNFFFKVFEITLSFQTFVKLNLFIGFVILILGMNIYSYYKKIIQVMKFNFTQLEN
jgi:hypothetical protein